MKTLVNPDNFKAGTTLVIAPHADDEMIGCGGWLIISRRFTPERMVIYCAEQCDVRRQEYLSGCAGLQLNVTELSLKREDFTSETSLLEAALKLQAIIESFQPFYIFIPSLFDPHPEHKAAHTLLTFAIERVEFKSSSPYIIQYEGLVPLGNANWWLDIGDVFDEKLRRLEAYRSQDELYRLVKTIRHLNCYRGHTLLRRGIKSAEAYTRMTLEEYLLNAKATSVINYRA